MSTDAATPVRTRLAQWMPDTARRMQALEECLADHVRYFPCDCPSYQASCCSCEAKRLLGLLPPDEAGGLQPIGSDV